MDKGVYCSTAGSVFKDKKAFTEHYKSDFHLYNLKRRVAGLPPVTREWFEERKKQLLQTSRVKKQQVWTEPLTRKKFQSEATYKAFIESKKYKALLNHKGIESPPEPIISEKSNKQNDKYNETEVKDDEEWDITVSLFDCHKSDSMELSLKHMFQKYGFFLPHPEYLVDAEGLIKYLGAKLSQGHIPLYCSGMNPNARTFKSLQAVQSHMIDTNKCMLLFDENEEEYEDYYDLDGLFLAENEMQSEDAAFGFELQVRDKKTDQEKIIGNREFRPEIPQDKGENSSRDCTSKEARKREKAMGAIED